MNLINAMMLSCVKATELMEMKEFERLSFINNLQLKMHTSMCSGCRDYMKQSTLINELLSKSRSTSIVVENTEELEEPNTKKLTRLKCIIIK